MAEAPKIPRIIRERLRVQQGGVREHPDVDILAAFSEDALPSGERAQVISHLSGCGSCREIVMLAQPEAVEPEKAGKVPASRLISWMAFRWAALAACFVLTVGVLLIDRSQRSERTDFPRPTAPPPAASSDAQATAEGEAALAISEPKVGALAGKATATQKRVEPQSAQRARLSGEGGGVFRLKENAVPPAEAESFVVGGTLGRLERRQPASTKEEDSRRADASAAAAPAYDDVSQMHAISSGRMVRRPSGGLVSGPTAMAKATSPPERNQAAGYAPVAPPAIAASVAEDSPNSELPEQEPGKKKLADETQTLARPATSGQRVLTRDDRSAVAQSLATSASNFKFEAKDQPETLTSNADKLETASPTPMQWRIRGGKLQQSNDEGKTWQEISIPPGVSLRSFWSLGNSVWAGGTQGSLFHITESGKNSVRIPIKVGEGDVSQTVVAVTFSDELNGIITLENGQILRTTDGGKTWERH